MAEFYGRLRGNRGEATRCGSRASGITATAQSWQTVATLRAYQAETTKRVSLDIAGKYGGTLLSFDIDADGLQRHRVDEKVSEAIDKLNEAVRGIEEAIEMAELADELTKAELASS